MRRLFIVVSLVGIIAQLALSGRYYDARTGRFLQVDPKLEKFPGWSPYNYALENPLKFIDPTGDAVHAYSERLGLGIYSKNASGLVQQVPSQLRPQALLLGGLAWEAVGPRHSFLRITTDKFDKLVELGGPLEGHREGNPLAPDVKGTLLERPGQEEHTVQRPEGVSETDYSFENKILDIHTSVSNYIKANNLPIYDGLTGPNSNGYAQFLIEAAGGKVSLPINAVARNVMAQYWKIYQHILDQGKQKKEEVREGEQK